jgi:serine/threonine-protein kinase
MGVVYVVEHVHTGDQVALKLLFGRAAKDPQSIERFKREARASARIKSEHVVKVIDADVAPELEGAPFLVMELLNGSDLQHQLERRGRFTADEVLQYLAQAARALDKSHALGIVHRDLKPENLFLHTREDGTTLLKILDFGISKLVGGDPANDIAGAGMTSTGAVMGTPLYMSPEQARGRIAEISPATDVWAIGLIAVQMLTGEIYWRANTVGELMAQIISEPLYAPTTRWPVIPPALDAWFARSCAREPRQRFASVGEQVDALALALGRKPQGSASAEATAPRDAIGASAAQAASSGGPIQGASTTTSATAREGTSAPPRGRMMGIIAAAGVAGGLAAAVVVGFRASPPAAAQQAAASATETSSPQAQAPAAAPSGRAAPAAETSASAIAAPLPTGSDRPGAVDAGVARTGPPRRVAPSSAPPRAASPAPAAPAAPPPPRPTAHTFDPSSP